MSSITEFYREACALLTRYGSTLPQPPATEENAIAFCRALAEEGIPVPEFPQLEECDVCENVVSSCECWECDGCGEKHEENDDRLVTPYETLCEECVEICETCDGVVMDDDADNYLHTHECECVSCELCDEKKHEDDGMCEGGGAWMCYDCWMKHDEVKVVFGRNQDGLPNVVLYVAGDYCDEKRFDLRDLPMKTLNDRTCEIVLEFKQVSIKGNDLWVKVRWDVRDDEDYSVANIKSVLAMYDAPDGIVFAKNVKWNEEDEWDSEIKCAWCNARDTDTRDNEGRWIHADCA